MNNKTHMFSSLGMHLISFIECSWSN